jgi:hypothetical protein
MGGHQLASCCFPLLFKRCQDCPPDKLGDLRHYGVSEGANSVWDIGNPIISSTNTGFG